MNDVYKPGCVNCGKEGSRMHQGRILCSDCLIRELRKENERLREELERKENDLLDLGREYQDAMEVAKILRKNLNAIADYAYIAVDYAVGVAQEALNEEATPKRKAEYVDISEKIKKIITTTLELENLYQLEPELRSENTTLEQLDIDSLDLVEIAIALEEELNIEITDKDISVSKTLRELIDTVYRKLSQVGKE